MITKEKNIHYFPGHMKKALREIAPYVKLVDLVVEVVDARAPYASRNPFLKELIGSKTHMLLLSKDDFADPEVTKLWIEEAKKDGVVAFAGNLKKDRIVARLKETSAPLFAAKREKEARLGMKKQPIRVMVIGVPNVGKSTFINSLRGKAKAKVQNKAGLTRSEQWINVNEDFMLLDTPGVLPMNYEDRETAINLALLGTMREDVLPHEELAEILLAKLKERYPSALNARFDIPNISQLSDHEVLISIAKRRGLLDKGEPSTYKAAYLLLKEFKDGVLGRLSLEIPNA